MAKQGLGELTPPTRSKLSQQIFDALIDHIAAEDLQPGDQLPSIGDLSERFRISRPVVREALSALEAVGLVEIASGRNASIREVDGHLISLFLTQSLRSQPEPLTALMEIRAPLEVQCAVLAAVQSDAEHIALIESKLAAMEATLHDGHRYPELDIAFHREIARSTGNAALMWVTDALRAQLSEVMFRVRSYREEHQLVGNEQAQHRAITAAIRAGDTAAARSAMEEHMAESVRLVGLLERAPR